MFPKNHKMTQESNSSDDKSQVSNTFILFIYRWAISTIPKLKKKKASGLSVQVTYFST